MSVVFVEFSVCVFRLTLCYNVQRCNRLCICSVVDVSSKYTTPPVKMIDDRWAGLPV